jgi:hypothetical protein
MRVSRLITCLGYAAIGTLALTGVGPASALGAGDQAHMEHASAQNLPRRPNGPGPQSLLRFRSAPYSMRTSSSGRS